MFACPHRETESPGTEFPLTCHHVSTPVVDLLNQVAARPEAPLLTWEEPDGTIATWSYRGFARRARACAALLQAKGVAAGERVALVCRNSAQRQAWQYGIWWLGAVEVSVNYDLAGDLLAAVLNDSEPSLIVLDAEFKAAVAGCYRRIDTARHLETLADFPPEDAHCPRLPESPAATRLDEIAHAVEADALCSLIYTSGTTGPSKGVMLPAGYPTANGHTIAHVAGLTSEDTGYFVLPFFHADFHVVFSAVILSGGSVAIRPKFSANRFWSEVTRFGVTWTWTVGFLFSAIRSQGADAATDTPLRRIIGAPIPDGTYEYFEDQLGIDILTLYGQTEADGPLYDTPGRKRRGGIGWPSVGFEVQIHDEHGHELPPDTPGELVYRPKFPHMMMLGYWNRPEATASAWRDLWVRSGDRASMDQEGFVFFHGRMSDSIRRRGENVSVYELESTLRKAPGVEECAAVGVDDDFSGEQEIKVFVVPSGADDEHSHEFTVAAFQNYCRDHVAPYARPKFLQITDSKNIVRSPGTQVVQKHRLLRAVAEEEEATGVPATVYTIDV
ncbi:crotonobetaine/carnitine-CoA ligase [Prauserella flava]|nr:crotonobetaine/carnitine-CoA ligase [Prauserella flava]MCR3735941.1 crotonobetaine/carnitine-CoA ligase [Prauserella salsuginis]